MSSIHNTQCCLLKAAGVTYERLRPICLTLFSCSSCHAVCMSAAAADRSFSCPPLQPSPSTRHPTMIPARLRNGLAMWGYSGTKRAVTLWPPEVTFLTGTSYFLPLRRKTKTNLIVRLDGSKGGGEKKKEKPSIKVKLWQSSIHMTCDFSDRVCLTPATERWVYAGCPSLASPALISSPLHLSCPSALCAQLNKQARGSFPLWKPWKMARTCPPPPYLGSPSGEGTLALTAPLVQSQCVFWWAYTAAMAFTLHWLQWDWPTRLTPFESTNHFNNVTKTKQSGDAE